LPEPVEPQDGAGERCVAEVGGPGSAAFAAWLERRRPELLAHLARRLSPALRRQMQAEDILQEAVLEALRAPARLARCGGDGWRAWVLAIAENRIRLAARRAQPRSRPRRTTPLADGLVRHDVELSAVPAAAPTDEERAGLREETLRLCSALRALSGDERTALVLRTWLDLSWETVAFVLDRPSAGAARQLHARARRKLAAKARGP